MDLKVPITISDELSDEVIVSSGLLNLASGEISRDAYQDYDADLRGLPWEPKYKHIATAEIITGALVGGVTVALFT